MAFKTTISCAREDDICSELYLKSVFVSSTKVLNNSWQSWSLELQSPSSRGNKKSENKKLVLCKLKTLILGIKFTRGRVIDILSLIISDLFRFWHLKISEKYYSSYLDMLARPMISSFFFLCRSAFWFLDKMENK